MASSTLRASLRTPLKAAVLALALVVLQGASSWAQTLSQEPAEIRLGQRVLVDDGSCPVGQIKQVTGARLTPQGVERERVCVDRRMRR